MEINTQNVTAYHPVNAQAALRSDSQVQDRGPDSIPPAKSSGDSSGAGTEYDNSKTSGRFLDTSA